jgi:bifunctional non-homologous end joining protein LigD
MLLTPVPASPDGQDCLHEAKLDGWGAQAEARGGQLHLRSRGGHDWADRLPELWPLGDLGDVVLDRELVVTTPDGRADFELLGGRMQQRAHFTHRVTYYAFDLLRQGEQELLNQSWESRRTRLDDLELTIRAGGSSTPNPLEYRWPRHARGHGCY